MKTALPAGGKGLRPVREIQAEIPPGNSAVSGNRNIS